MKELKQARIKLLQYKKAAFFAYLNLRLPVKISDEVDTAATDGYHILLNEEFFLSLTVPERVFLLFHETLHVALKHTIYRGNRDARLWNVAADYIINAALVDYGLPIPKGGLYDRKYAGLTTEKVYEMLKQEADQHSKPDYDDLIYENGKTNSTQNNQNSNNSQTNSSKEHQNSEKLVPPLSNQEIEAKISEELVMAQTASSLSGEKGEIGTLPADIERFFAELQKPKLPWRVILRRFLRKQDRKITLRRPNRRYMPKYYLPARKGKGLSRVDFVIDTSGSISKEEFTEFLSEVNAVLKEFKPNEIGLSQFDSTYYGTDVISKYTDLHKIKFKGGGGTVISSTLKALDNVNTEALIILTDGYITDIGNSTSKHEVVWCVYDNPNFVAPFGKTILFDS